MVTSTHQVSCPKCGKVNSYEIANLQFVDTDLQATYQCECGCRFNDIYALVYLGGFTDGQWYDRDNVSLN